MENSTGTAATVTNNALQAKKPLLITIGLIILLLAAAAGGWWWWYSRTTIATDNAKVAADLIDISPKVGGRIQAIHVKEQETVKAGQILLELENEQYKAELQRAEANLELAQANLEKLKNGARPEEREQVAAVVDQCEAAVNQALAAKVQNEASLRDAERLWAKKEQLYQQGVISQEDLESARSSLEKAQAAVESASASLEGAQNKLREAKARQALVENGPLPQDLQICEAQVKQAEAALALAKLNYENTIIRAPVDGTVARINAEVGETFSPGQTAITLVDLAHPWIQVNLEETEMYRVAVGQKAKVTIDAYPGAVFEGEITEIGSAAGSVFSLIPTENTSGNYTKVVQRFSLKIKVDAGEYQLKPGMSAVVKIKVR